MASIVLGVIVFSYDAVAKSIRRRRATKAQSAARFSELEQENLARIQRLSESCGCGGNHLGQEHPGGPYVGNPVIRNDMDGGGVRRYDGSDTRAVEDLPPGYDEVVAETRRR